MRKMVISLIVFVLLSLLIFTFEGVVSADIEKPTLHIGDYWNYEMNMYLGQNLITGNGRYEIKEEKTITVNGIEYNAYRATISITFTIPSSNEALTLDCIYYLNASDLGLIKDTVDSNLLGHLEEIYTPPESFEWPLIIGKSWQNETEMTEIEGSTSSIQEIIIYHECLYETEVTTPAGIFNCSVVNRWDNTNPSNYTLSYYSSNIGNYVKRQVYVDGKLSKVFTLLSYNYQSAPHSASDEKKSTPGFELVFVVFAMALVLFWKRRKMKL